MRVVFAKALPIGLYSQNQKTGTWVAVAVAGVGAATTVYEGSQNRKAAAQNSQAVQQTQYQPIDINALQQQAQEFAKQNAANSLAIEAQNEPGLSSARFGLQNTVAGQLAQGGNLTPDIYNQTARAAISGANSTGIEGAAGPITAASLGDTAMQLQQQRILNAQNLVNFNQLPASGIDPGSLVSAVIGQNNAQNQFDLSKLGATTAANQSTANANNALAGSVGGFAAGALQAYLNRPQTPAPTPAPATPFGNAVNTGGGAGFGGIASGVTN